MLLAQISDLHVMPPGRLAYGRVDTEAFTRAAVAQVNRLRPVPDAVLVTGDLADHGAPVAYALCREILSALPAPYYVIPGNHDGEESFKAAFRDHAYLPQNPGPIRYTIEHHPVRIVAIDSRIIGQVAGRVDDAQLAWLDGTLRQRPETPTVVMMHHPPFRTGLPHFDTVSLENPDALETVIRRHAQVERILCGHVHRATQIRFGGTIASACPGAAHQVTLDLRDGTDESFTMDPPGFQLHRWTGSRLYTYTANIGQFDGPYPFG
jgi:3',5'-cyclic-AMP phosphodiesterase